jgi:hypothetical protein
MTDSAEEPAPDNQLSAARENRKSLAADTKGGMLSDDVIWLACSQYNACRNQSLCGLRDLGAATGGSEVFHSFVKLAFFCDGELLVDLFQLRQNSLGFFDGIDGGNFVSGISIGIASQQLATNCAV